MGWYQRRVHGGPRHPPYTDSSEGASPDQAEDRKPEPLRQVKDRPQGLGDAEVTKKFEQSGWGKRIKASTLRANLSDFEKFKVNKLKVQRRRLVGAQVNKAAKK